MPWWGVVLIGVAGLITGGLAVLGWLAWYFSKAEWF